jgi:hypothetical protein
MEEGGRRVEENWRCRRGGDVNINAMMDHKIHKLGRERKV